MKYFFVSDTHFGHQGAINYCMRPYKSVEEMDEALIQNWNSVVSAQDIVFHLGDLSFHRPARTLEILDRLNGNKHLVLGNHDKNNLNAACKNKFSWVKDYYELKIDEDDNPEKRQTIILCHYPIESWNKRHRGGWHLHGHCHGSLSSASYQFRVDVGVDVWNYIPASFEQIKEHMSHKEFKAIDHHSMNIGDL